MRKWTSYRHVYWKSRHIGLRDIIWGNYSVMDNYHCFCEILHWFTKFTNKRTCKALDTKYSKKNVFKAILLITDDGPQLNTWKTWSPKFKESKHTMWSDCKHYKYFTTFWHPTVMCLVPVMCISGGWPIFSLIGL